jgi:hypothetical protein
MSALPPLTIGRWGGDEPESDDTQAPPPASVRAPDLPAGSQMSWFQQSNAAVVYTVRTAWHRFRDREQGVVRGLIEAKPESLAEHSAYVESRRWVQSGYEGGIAERAGVIYGRTAGRAGVALFNAGSAIAARPLRGCLAFLTLYVLAVIGLYALGHRFAAVALTGGLAAFAFLAWLALWAISGRSPYDDDTEEEDIP